ncbi:MAG: ADP-ribosylglycohydrolase family protein [Anaerolineae bacterium]
MTLPVDYEERVYAGVLGKIIGVYLGRPFEGWTYDQIIRELGEIDYYVHDELGSPLIVTDDDISGTFTFVRALEDYGYARDITPAQIGQTWLNYIIEQRTILWWGGMGNSTEHTAFLRLKSGVEPPQSGAIQTNGRVVAEQIGAQIFIDGWAMVAPGDPELAADLARRAASVSHDGEAIYGAQVLAAMEAQAFVESDIHALLDIGTSVIPKDSIVYRLITELRELRQREEDWRAARRWLEDAYGYHKYGGGVHMIPNHGLIILSLLWGYDDFQRTMMIVNTSGWDTDCNSGNAGCLMGIKNGLDGLETGPDYRGPVADRLYLPTADGGRAVTDALIETYHLVNSGRALVGLPPRTPKKGARYHFDLPGAVQGFLPDTERDASGTLTLENAVGHSETGKRSLALHYRGVAKGRIARTGTATFLAREAAEMPGYGLICSPTLYPGQTVQARLEAEAANRDAVDCNLYLRYYDSHDERVLLRGPRMTVLPAQQLEFTWRIPNSTEDSSVGPIAEIGLEIHSDRRADGTLYLDYLTWDGSPDVALSRPGRNSGMALRAWVNGVNHFAGYDGLRISQDRGTGLLIQGTRMWADYEVRAVLRPHLARRVGLAARVQGLERYYALLLSADNTLSLVKCLDGEVTLSETAFEWHYDETYELTLRVEGQTVEARVNGELYFVVTDRDRPLRNGAVALVCEEGRIDVPNVQVRPIT